MSDEEKIWTGSPSQLVNTWAFVIRGLLGGLVIAGSFPVWRQLHARFPAAEIKWFLLAVFAVLAVLLLSALWRWLRVHYLDYELTTERLRISVGVFSRRVEEIELYRVKDTTLDAPFMLRMFGLGNITVETHDVSAPRVLIHAVSGASEVREKLRATVEAVREKKHVRVLEPE